MKTSQLILMSLLLTGLLTRVWAADELPEGYWSLQQASEVLAKTRSITLDPDTSSLTTAEKAATENLIQAGIIFNRLYEDSLHPQALESLAELNRLGAQGGQQA